MSSPFEPLSNCSLPLNNVAPLPLPEHDLLLRTISNSPAPATAPTSGTGGSLSCSSRGSPPVGEETAGKRPFVMEGEEAFSVEGRSKRKKTKTKVFEIGTEENRKRVNSAARFVEGRGVRLGTIPNVVYAVDKCNNKDPQIELLHRVLFNSAGQALRRKQTIRSFNGFVFRTDKERSRIRDKLTRVHFHMVRKIAYLLDVDTKESKEETADAILFFLEEPKLLEGRGNRQERERLQKAERKRAEKARAKKRKAEELEKLQKAIVPESDSDGDEDLEFYALSWIEFAQLGRKARQRAEEAICGPETPKPEEDTNAIVPRSPDDL